MMPITLRGFSGSPEASAREGHVSHDGPQHISQWEKEECAQEAKKMLVVKTTQDNGKLFLAHLCLFLKNTYKFKWKLELQCE